MPKIAKRRRARSASVLVSQLLAVGSLEFVGPFEERGWNVAALIVPVTYMLGLCG